MPEIGIGERTTVDVEHAAAHDAVQQREAAGDYHRPAGRQRAHRGGDVPAQKRVDLREHACACGYGTQCRGHQRLRMLGRQRSGIEVHDRHCGGTDHGIKGQRHIGRAVEEHPGDLRGAREVVGQYDE